uniref:Uncharacterized protein n=1 Tax=Pseudo-nitzschia australis TaxID=44445 RepID=A0A6U9YD54_9STRA
MMSDRGNNTSSPRRLESFPIPTKARSNIHERGSESDRDQTQTSQSLSPPSLLLSRSSSHSPLRPTLGRLASFKISVPSSPYTSSRTASLPGTSTSGRNMHGRIEQIQHGQTQQSQFGREPSVFKRSPASSSTMNTPGQQQQKGRGSSFRRFRFSSSKRNIVNNSNNTSTSEREKKQSDGNSNNHGPRRIKSLTDSFRIGRRNRKTNDNNNNNNSTNNSTDTDGNGGGCKYYDYCIDFPRDNDNDNNNHHRNANTLLASNNNHNSFDDSEGSFGPPPRQILTRRSPIIKIDDNYRRINNNNNNNNNSNTTLRSYPAATGTQANRRNAGGHSGTPTKAGPPGYAPPRQDKTRQDKTTEHNRVGRPRNNAMNKAAAVGNGTPRNAS